MRSVTGSARFSSPVRVGDVLVSAVPALQERLLAERIRAGWRDTVGPNLARRSRPGDLRAGTLTVTVDNSPWLQELSMRAADVLGAVRARFGPAVTAVRFSLDTSVRPPHASEERPVPERAAFLAVHPKLSGDDAAFVEQAAAPVHDPTLAKAVRRVLTKDLIARRAREGARP